MKRLLTSCLVFCAALPSVAGGNAHSQGGLSASEQKTTARPAEMGKRPLDACALLTREEIRAVQGESVAEIKPRVEPAGGFILLGCLYRSARFSKSVSLALATPGPSASPGPGPRQFWESQFHGSAVDKESEGEGSAAKAAGRGERAQDAGGEAPRRVMGVGQEAYWVGDPIFGALYVLQGDRFLRISVGGERVELTRLQKSKVLAESALKRLQADSIQQ